MIDDIKMLHPGDQVRIVSKWLPSGVCMENDQGMMDIWLGHIMTVKEVYDTICTMEEDDARWGWNGFCIEEIVCKNGNTFRIGDRVQYVSSELTDRNEELTIGCTGTVVFVSDSEIYVCWDHSMKRGHDCNGMCETKHGWRVPPRRIRHYVEEDTQDIDESEFAELLVIS